MRKRRIILPAKRLKVILTPVLIARFVAKVKQVRTDVVKGHPFCWEWQAGLDKGQGYGQFKYDGQSRGAHRVAYAMFVRPLRDGEQPNHLCRNIKCVNPYHLTGTTRAKNIAHGNRTRHKWPDAVAPF